MLLSCRSTQGKQWSWQVALSLVLGAAFYQASICTTLMIIRSKKGSNSLLLLGCG